MKIAPIRRISSTSNFKSNSGTGNVCANDCPNGACKPTNKPNWAGVTGWATIAGLALTAVTGAMHKPKIHLFTAMLPIATGIAHIACVTSHHNHHKNNINTKV